MTQFISSAHTYRRAYPAPVRRATELAALLAALAISMLILAAGQARAVVTQVKVGAGDTAIGMEPRSTVDPLAVPPALRSFDNKTGGSVMHSAATYAIYWDPEYGYHGDWEHLVNTFLHDVGAVGAYRAAVNAVAEQYTDKANARATFAAPFRGAYSDVKAYPANGCTDPDLSLGFPDEEAKLDNVACLTDAQLREELQAFIAQNGLHTGMGTIFFLLTPPGVTVCVEKGESVSAYCSDDAPSASSQGDSFCSYHSYINPSNDPEGAESTIVYAVIPWTAGGIGDPQLFDRVSGYECQDGGYDASAKEPEESEASPRQQEPNQGTGRSPDGGFDTGLADLVANQVSVEQRNAITDPLLNAWHDSAGDEVVDECRNFFAANLGGDSKVAEESRTGGGTLFNQLINAHTYYLNGTFNFASLLLRYPAIECLPGISVEPQFTAPNPVNAGEIVGFDAAESNISLDAGVNFNASREEFRVYPTYDWDFGDGTQIVSPYPPGASPVDQPSVFHSYQYGGTYDVTLTIVDVGGNTATFSRTVLVDGPPPPSAPTGTGSGGSSGRAGPVTTTTSAGAPAPSAGSATTKPRLYEKVASRSLGKAVRYGLAVGYYANEQVAGAMQVMLDRATAKRLRIKAPFATALPKGYARQVVIGGAVLVTTTAGHGMLRVTFPRQIAKRLAHAHKVKLTLRVVVRNADRAHPQTATLLSTVILK